jgi:GT2 family glycosyltransferase
MSVTVVIPTHGRSPYLTEAVASAREARPAEILVVEDGTADADESTLAGARLIRLDRVGRSRARNAGVQAAETEYVAFLDADDVALPDRFERQHAALESEPDAPMCFGAVTMADADLEPDAATNEVIGARFARLVSGPANFERILATRCPIYTSATMVRRDAFLSAGGYDPRFDAYEDLDLYLRLSRLGNLVPCPGGPVTLYRLHDDNTASDLLYANMLGVVAKHLPDARGRERRMLLERRLEALWGLGRFGQARRAALTAAARHPLLLADPGFAKRAAGSLLPGPVLTARRR